MVRVRLMCPKPRVSCAYSRRVRAGEVLISRMTLSLTNRNRNGLRHRAGRSAQQLGQQIRDAVEPAKIDAAAAWRRRTQLTREPCCQCPWTEIVGLKHIDQ